jgi:hypothetical protein
MQPTSGFGAVYEGAIGGGRLPLVTDCNQGVQIENAPGTSICNAQAIRYRCEEDVA